jgi:hypothetical protein
VLAALCTTNVFILFTARRFFQLKIQAHLVTLVTRKEWEPRISPMALMKRDEEKRQNPGPGVQFAIPPEGGFKAIFIRFFISGIGVIRGRSPHFLVAAERSEAALGKPRLD